VIWRLVSRDVPQTGFAPMPDCLSAIRYLKFAQDIGDMVTHCLAAQDQSLGDLVLL
jgi:hypothetical protein